MRDQLRMTVPFGSGPFCRNGPSGASHKRVLTPFLPPQEEIEAIRAVILSGFAGDFQDVASAVQKEYRLSVSASLVEEVYRQMRDAETPDTDAMARGPHPSQPLREAAGGEKTLHQVLRFAQEMGGFDQARAALDAVQKKLKELT